MSDERRTAGTTSSRLIVHRFILHLTEDGDDEAQRHSQKRDARLAAALLAAALLALPRRLAAQAKKPITREGLVKAVRINGLSTAELVQQIQSRGVSFRMTPDAEAELRAAGARPEVIAAARSNYRAGPGRGERGGRRPPAGRRRPPPAAGRTTTT